MESQEEKQRLDWLEGERRQDQHKIAAISERLADVLEQVDATQIDKRLEWLEEERRQDNKIIATLTERLNGVLDTNAIQAHRVTELETEAARLTAYLAKMTNLEESFDNIRTEFTHQIEALEQRHLEADHETERLRALEREGINRAMADVKKATEPIVRLEQEIVARREEERRLGRMIVDVKQIAESAAHTYQDISGGLSKLEESTRQEGRRGATLQTETTDLRRRIEEYIGKLEVIEDLARRNDAKVNEILALETDRRISQQSWMESQAIIQAERERIFNDIQQHTEGLETLASDVTRQLEKYAELQRNTEKVTVAFQDTLDRLERRINEAGEIQRLQEEQFRQEWAAFQADDQKKWTTHMLLRDEQWRDHDRDYQKYMERLAATVDELAELGAEFTRMKQMDQARLQSLFNFARELLAEYDTQLQKVR